MEVDVCQSNDQKSSSEILRVSDILGVAPDGLLNNLSFKQSVLRTLTGQEDIEFCELAYEDAVACYM